MNNAGHMSSHSLVRRLPDVDSVTLTEWYCPSVACFWRVVISVDTQYSCTRKNACVVT